MATQPFNHEQALKDWTELSRLIRLGASEEHRAEHYEVGTYPEDGVEESLANLEALAAQHGLQFTWHEDTNTYALEPLSPEELAASQANEVEIEVEMDEEEEEENQQEDIRHYMDHRYLGGE